MTKETKQDVFEDMALRYTMYLENVIYENGNQHSSDNEAQHDADKFRARYAAASPCKLPVIPQAVGDVIVKLKHKKFSLSGAMTYAAVVSLSPWMTFEHEDTFALAWVLGVWRVEETGEILKLDADFGKSRNGSRRPHDKSDSSK